MSELILHHYAASPFSEKVRLILGYKGLSWHSVRIPAVLPKPDVLALTGGYRKTPLLQVENHIYCDTALIARVLENRAPEPSLFSDPRSETLSEWADTTLFGAAAVLGSRPSTLDKVMTLMDQEEMMRFRDDRAAMREGARSALPRYPTAGARFREYAARLETMCERSHYLGSDAPSIFDFSVYLSLWFIQMLAPEHLKPFPKVRKWMELMSRIGHGTETPMSSAAAIARCAQPSSLEMEPEPEVSLDGISVGQRVSIAPDDWGCDATVGVLTASYRNEVVIKRTDDRAGNVFVHFPRVGYDIDAAVE